MEGEKKKKRAAGDGDAGGGGGGSRRRKERDQAKAEAMPAPTDEEVDEFFAILRRMQVAVKYFDKGRGGTAAAGRKSTGKWTTAWEAEVLAGINGVKAAEESVCGVRKNGVPALDLNAVPEAETSNSL